jgi:hypothetical protein
LRVETEDIGGGGAPRNPRWFINVAPETMDEKSLNLWRQIEGARRVGKRLAVVRLRPAPGAGGVGVGG